MKFALNFLFWTYFADNSTIRLVSLRLMSSFGNFYFSGFFETNVFFWKLLLQLSSSEYTFFGLKLCVVGLGLIGKRLGPR
jgi:hypothetical protein